MNKKEWTGSANEGLPQEQAKDMITLMNSRLRETSYSLGMRGCSVLELFMGFSHLRAQTTATLHGSPHGRTPTKSQTNSAQFQKKLKQDKRIKCILKLLRVLRLRWRILAPRRLFIDRPRVFPFLLSVSRVVLRDGLHVPCQFP